MASELTQQDSEPKAVTPSSSRSIKQGLTLVVTTLFIISVSAALYSIKTVVLVFFIGIVLGVVIAPAHPFLKSKLRIPYGVTSACFLLFFLLCLAGATMGLSYLVANELLPLLEQLPSLIDRGLSWVSERLAVVPAAQRIVQSFALDVRQYMPDGRAPLITGLRIGLETIVFSLFVIAVSLYLSTDIKRYKEGFLALFPHHLRSRASGILRDLARTLRHWLFAQLIVMLYVAAITSVTLYFLGMDNWLAYGIMAGLLDIIPYVGPILSGTIIGLVALGTDPQLALMVVIAFALIQQIEGYIIFPMVMKGEVELPPVYLLILIFAMGSWFGFIGVFAAPALLAVTREAVLKIYVPYMNQKKSQAS